MIDFSSELQKYHDECLSLNDEARQELEIKKNLNIERLRNGLKEYNEENNTSYKIQRFVVQGSMAMDTAIQSEENDFDIDVGIVFDSNSIDDVGHIKIKRVVVECFKNKWPGQFSKDPEEKKNCVRIEYSEGYHLDFAIYKHSKYYNLDFYEHAGSTSWNSRDPFAINEWFKKETILKGQYLKTIIRFSKSIVKSSVYTIIPGGLIQTVLLTNLFVYDDRLDYCFYKTIKEASKWLSYNNDIKNPVDNSLSLITTEEHITQLQNYKKILDKVIFNIERLINSTSDYIDSANTWNTIFDCEYWNAKLEESYSLDSKNAISLYENNTYEKFIENMYYMNLAHNNFRINCEIGFEGQRKTSLTVVNARYKGVPIGPKIYCSVKPSFEYDKILWKVRNRGVNAQTAEKIRGQIDSNRGLNIIETSDFSGNHYIECYAIKNNSCIAVAHINIRIINKVIKKGVL